ncbi:MAG: c-type cytochrome, partial [Calditrichia bacterium]
MFIIIFIFMIVNDHFARENAVANHLELLTQRAEEVETSLREEREAGRAQAVEVDLALGRDVYQNICSSCHRFDEKLVGPPYNEVLPKYANKKDELIEFVKNPYDISPSYPPMPDLGLNEQQVRSVIAYLFEQLEETR